MDPKISQILAGTGIESSFTSEQSLLWITLLNPELLAQARADLESAVAAGQLTSSELDLAWVEIEQARDRAYLATDRYLDQVATSEAEELEKFLAREEKELWDLQVLSNELDELIRQQAATNAHQPLTTQSN